jgi:hypothetical protein
MSKSNVLSGTNVSEKEREDVNDDERQGAPVIK